jgi:biopolymer transport protein ExbD
MRRGIFKRRKEDLLEASLFSFKIGYINLMKTLVPVLLSIAVFSRLAMVDLHLPKLEGGSTEVALQEGPPASSFSLVVAIQKEGIAVSNGERALAFLRHQDRKLDLDGLSLLMQKVKKENPDEKEVIILSQPKTPYEELIAVMDACRSVKVEDRSDSLFPNVSLGEAPV